MRLSQNGFTVYLSFQQTSLVNATGNQPHVHGSAYYESAGGRVQGYLQGNLYRDNFDVTVQWENATRGNYRADIVQNYWIGPHGEVELVGELKNGTTHDEQHPGRAATPWVTDSLLSCHRFGP